MRIRKPGRLFLARSPARAGFRGSSNTTDTTHCFTRDTKPREILEPPVPGQIVNDSCTASTGTSHPLENNKKIAVKLKEAATMLSVSVKTLRRKIENREIAVCRATRHITIEVAELERFLKRNTVKL